MSLQASRPATAALLLASACLSLSTAALADPRPGRGHAPHHAADDSHPTRDNATTRAFRTLGRNAKWTPVATVPMNFTTFHTQGMVRIGERFYVSAVEVLEPTQRHGATDALTDFSVDRTAGAGRGWLFMFDPSGQLLGRTELTDGVRYHPGGMDFDGRHLWVPVAEYRPNSSSNLYRVDPQTLASELVHRAGDHIGGLVHDVHTRTLHGVSWGSRRLYEWDLGPRGQVRERSQRWTPNPQWVIDYQDCHYQGVSYMLCGGVAGYSTPMGNMAFGGIDLVDLRRSRMEHQVPVNLFIDEGRGGAGLALTHNAFWLEPLGDGRLRGYFMTETNNQAQLRIYDIAPWTKP